MALTSESNLLCESDLVGLGCVGFIELSGFPSTKTRTSAGTGASVGAGVVLTVGWLCTGAEGVGLTSTWAAVAGTGVGVGVCAGPGAGAGAGAGACDATGDGVEACGGVTGTYETGVGAAVLAIQVPDWLGGTAVPTEPAAVPFDEPVEAAGIRLAALGMSSRPMVIPVTGS
jgi:hypothetical protein